MRTFVRNKMIQVMMTKERVLSTLRELPDEFTLDDLFEKLIVIEKIETDLLQVREGKIISHQEVKEKAKEWCKQTGANKP